jgi:DNA-binding phage protein
LEGVSSSDFAKILSGDVTTDYDLVEYLKQDGQANQIANQLLQNKDGAEVISSLTGLTKEQIEKELQSYGGSYSKYLSSILQDKAKETEVG